MRTKCAISDAFVRDCAFAYCASVAQYVYSLSAEQCFRLRNNTISDERVRDCALGTHIVFRSLGFHCQLVRKPTLPRLRQLKKLTGALYRTLMEDQMPPPPLVIAGDRSSAVDVHQLGASHWSGPQQYLHRMRRNSTEECRQSPISPALRAGASCALEETDTK